MRSNRKGFTLIELLIVVVIIGILAASAIPKFANTKEKAYVTAMKSDLKNLSTAEEAFFADSNRYGSKAELGTAYNTSVGVAVAITAGASTWTASATHSSTAKTCALAMTGSTQDGTPICQ